MSCCDPAIDARLMQHTKTVAVAAVTMIDEDNRILIAQRPEGKSFAGLWEFPGGKIEQSETPEAALVREIKEELQVKTCAGCLSPLTFTTHCYDDFYLFMALFACRQWEGLVLANEGQVLKWVRAHQLKDYPMPEANRPLLAMIHHLI